MKTLLSLLVLLSFTASAQEWKERYVTSWGDTVTPQSKVKLNIVDVRYKYVKPSKNFPTNNPTERQPIAYDQYRKNYDYLNIYMKGKEFPIHRLTRIKDNGVYKEFATILMEDARMLSTINSFEFVVDIEEAVKNKEVELTN